MQTRTISPLQIIIAAAALIIWLTGAYTAGQTAAMTDGVLIRFENGVSPAELNRQEAYFREDNMRNMPDAAIWREVTNQSVTGGKEYSTIGVTVTEISGDMYDVNQNRLLSGVYPQKSDGEGCVISDTAAFALWNGVEVIGMPVYWDDGLYYVRGVVRDDNKTLLVQADAASVNPFPNMRLRFPEGGGREEALTYLNKAGFTGGELLDLPVLAYGLELLAFLPALYLTLAALVKLLRQAFRLAPFPALLSMYLPLAAVGSALCVWAAAFAPGIPDRLVPGKWSNFEFIGGIFTNIIERVRSWLSNPGAGDLTLWGSVLTAAVLLVAALALMGAVTGRIKIKSPKEWGFAVFGSLAVMFASALIYANVGGLRINTGMWLAPVIWITADFGINRFDKWIMPHETAEEADLVIVDIDTLDVTTGITPEQNPVIEEEAVT